MGEPRVAASAGPLAGEGTGPDSRRWLREMGVLLALPAMWVDQPPTEIAESLLSVLAGMLQTDAAFVRFEAADRGEAIEARRSADGELADLLAAVAEPPLESAGMSTMQLPTPRGPVRVARLPLTMPWERAIVLVAARRASFPTALETHLLRIATGQAVISFHAARRLTAEQCARVQAEAALRRRDALIRSLAGDLEPALAAASRGIREAVRALAETAPGDDMQTTAAGPPRPGAPPSLDVPQLSTREAQVLGLLAQGLSNKEIAGVLWLSDRTVERHITSLYRKIGVGRRSEATAFALRHASA